MKNNSMNVADIQGTLAGDIYRNEQKPSIADVKQVIDTLKDKVQPLTPVQMQVLGYLEYLQSRSIHGKTKPYDALIRQIEEDAHKVAPPGFFIRIIEALIPRTMYVDGKSYEKMANERDGK